MWVVSIYVEWMQYKHQKTIIIVYEIVFLNINDDD